MTPADKVGKKGSIRFLWAVLVILPLVSPWCLSQADANEWPMFRGTALQSGVSKSVLVLPLKLAWTRQIPDGIESTAAIRDGRIFVGGLDGGLYSLNLNDGKKIWSFQGSDEIKSSPTVSDGLVFFGDEGGSFRALEVDSGRVRWTFEAGSGITSSANLMDGKVVFGSYDNSVYALEAGTGEKLWQFETDGYVHGTPLILGGQVVVGGCDGVLRIIELGTGSQAGSVDLLTYLGASPASPGQDVFVGTFDNEVLRIDLEEREIVWRYQHPERHFPFYSSAALSEGLVVVGGRDKLVHAIRSEDGRAAWTYQTRARVDSSPVISGTTVFGADGRGVVFALDLHTGKELWSFEAGGGFVASPSIAAGSLLVGSVDGMLYCFVTSK